MSHKTAGSIRLIEFAFCISFLLLLLWLMDESSENYQLFLFPSIIPIDIFQSLTSSLLLLSSLRRDFNGFSIGQQEKCVPSGIARSSIQIRRRFFSLFFFLSLSFFLSFFLSSLFSIVDRWKRDNKSDNRLIS
jgi:hypothetical protein